MLKRLRAVGARGVGGLGWSLSGGYLMARVRRLGRRSMAGQEWQQWAFAGYIRSGGQALCSAFVIVGFADGSISAV